MSRFKVTVATTAMKNLEGTDVVVEVTAAVLIHDDVARVVEVAAVASQELVLWVLQVSVQSLHMNGASVASVTGLETGRAAAHNRDLVTDVSEMLLQGRYTADINDRPR